MWLELFQAFRRKDVIREQEAKIGEMIDAGEWMFAQVAEVLLRKTRAEDIVDALYERDRQVNRLEQDIREQIVTYLAVSEPGEFGPCLILMSVVKDAERIGDYCKNIFEVGKFYRGSFPHREYHDPLGQIRDTLQESFAPTKKAFLDEDTQPAKEIVQKLEALGKNCDMIIQQLLCTTGDIPAGEAVAYVLLARHYKRISSHLSNIATSVISPVPLLDFHGKV